MKQNQFYHVRVRAERYAAPLPQPVDVGAELAARVERRVTKIEATWR
jgi:hypothetical protein